MYCLQQRNTVSNILVILPKYYCIYSTKFVKLYVIILRRWHVVDRSSISLDNFQFYALYLIISSGRSIKVSHLSKYINYKLRAWKKMAIWSSNKREIFDIKTVQGCFHWSSIAGWQKQYMHQSIALFV